MRCIAVANHKGGCGKTALTVNLGAVLAEHSRVLLLDADPQASLTSSCGVLDAGRSLADVMGGNATLGDILRPLAFGPVLAPSDIALSAAELALVSRLGRENVLRRALATVAADFDVCLIDCPPSLGLMTVNSLVAADAVLIPVQPTAADLRGAALFLASLGELRAAGLNNGLTELGLLVTFYDARLLHHRDALAALGGAGPPVLPVTIPRSVRVAESMGAGQPVTVYDKRGQASEAYRQVGEVVKRWLNDRD